MSRHREPLAALVALTICLAPQQARPAATVQVSDEARSQKYVEILPDGRLTTLELERKPGSGGRRSFSLTGTYDQANPDYAKAIVYQKAPGQFLRADGTTASQEDFDRYEKGKNCAIPSVSAVTSAWESSKSNGAYGYDEKGEPIATKHFRSLGGVRFVEARKVTALGYQVSLKGETGSFVYENENGEKQRITGSRFSNTNQVTLLEAEETATARLGALTLAGKAYSFAGAKNENSAILGLTPAGGLVTGSAKAFFGAAQSFDASATLKSPFGIKLTGRGNLEGSFGLGGELGGNLCVSWDGKLRLGGKLAATVGLGAGGAATIELDASTLLTGVDLDKVDAHERWASIVGNATGRLRSGELRLKRGEDLRQFSADLRRDLDGLDPADKSAVTAFFSRYFEKPSLAVKLSGPGAHVPTGVPLEFAATVEGGIAPYTFTWASSEGPTVKEDPTRATRSTLTKKPFATPGKHWVRVTVEDRSHPNPLQATAQATLVVAPRFEVALRPSARREGRQMTVSVEAAIKGGVPPYSLVWTSWAGKAAPQRTSNQRATFRQTLELPAQGQRPRAPRVVLIATDSSPQPATATAEVTLPLGEPLALRLEGPDRLAPGQQGAINLYVEGGAAPYAIRVGGKPSGRLDGNVGNLPVRGAAEPGTYSVAISVTDAEGDEASATHRFEVRPAENPAARGRAGWKGEYAVQATHQRGGPCSARIPITLFLSADGSTLEARLHHKLESGGWTLGDDTRRPCTFRRQEDSLRAIGIYQGDSQRGQFEISLPGGWFRGTYSAGQLSGQVVPGTFVESNYGMPLRAPGTPVPALNQHGPRWTTSSGTLSARGAVVE